MALNDPSINLSPGSAEFPFNPAIGALQTSDMIRNRENIANRNQFLNQQETLQDIATKAQNRDIATQKLPYELASSAAATAHTGALTGQSQAYTKQIGAETAATEQKTAQSRMDAFNVDMLRNAPILDQAAAADKAHVTTGGQGTPNMDRVLNSIAESHDLGDKGKQITQHYKDAALGLESQDPSAVGKPFSALGNHIISMNPGYQEQALRSATEEKVAGIHSATQLSVTDKEIKSRLDLADKEISANPDKAATYYADAAVRLEQAGEPEKAAQVRMQAFQANKMAEEVARRGLQKIVTQQTALMQMIPQLSGVMQGKQPEFPQNTVTPQVTQPSPFVGANGQPAGPGVTPGSPAPGQIPFKAQSIADLKQEHPEYAGWSDDALRAAIKKKFNIDLR